MLKALTIGVLLFVGSSSQAEILAGDTDGDGDVDFTDFLALSANFGRSDGSAFLPPDDFENLSLPGGYFLVEAWGSVGGNAYDLDIGEISGFMVVTKSGNRGLMYQATSVDGTSYQILNLEYFLDDDPIERERDAPDGTIRDRFGVMTILNRPSGARRSVANWAVEEKKVDFQEQNSIVLVVIETFDNLDFQGLSWRKAW